jgi:hypothetical protein
MFIRIIDPALTRADINMKKSALIFLLTLIAQIILIAGHSAYANTFAVSDLQVVETLEKNALRLKQDMIRSGKGLSAQHDFEQLSCLNGLDAPLANVQGIITREKELLQLSTIMVNQTDEKKVELVLTLDIMTDLMLLDGNKGLGDFAGASCPGNVLVMDYADKVSDVANQSASALRSIQQRLPKH